MKKHYEKRKITQEKEPVAQEKQEFETMYVSSFNECTGLIPFIPSDNDYFGYHEIFDYCPEEESVRKEKIK